MSKIEDRFKKGKEENRALLIPYLTAGFPSLKTSEDIFKLLAKEGADILEIGIPFSDPMADGPTIQRASEAALAQGVTTKDVFQLVRNLREVTDIPLVVMTYYNLFYKYGLKEFADDAFDAGLDGIIIPDLPPEEAGGWLEAAKGRLDTVFLLAPTSSDARIEKIVKYSQGFVYCVSLTGVTGVRVTLAETLPDFITRARAKTDKALAVGFGVSTAEQARNVAKLADGVIIGSAFIKAIDQGANLENRTKAVRRLLHEFLPALQK